MVAARIDPGNLGGADLMARKTKTVVIEAEGRDKGKTFLLTELPALAAERWAIRALMAVADAGIDLPNTAIGAGMSALAVVGIQAVFRVPYERADPLLNEMMTCIQIIPDPKRPFPRALLDGSDDIEEVSTVLVLRSEVLELHVGFSVRDALSQRLASITQDQTSSDTSTFQPQ